MTTAIRPARPDEAPLVLDLVRGLARYEKLEHEVEATADGIAAALFGSAPRVFCDLAEADGEVAGFAMWFYTFSTFVGRPGIYLEDLFVRPEFRGRGLGKGLIVNLADAARKKISAGWSGRCLIGTSPPSNSTARRARASSTAGRRAGSMASRFARWGGLPRRWVPQEDGIEAG